MAYEKYTWKNGEIITQEKLNHIEDGIASIESSSFDLSDRMAKGSGTGAVIEGSLQNQASGSYSHAEGYGTTASKVYSHSEGSGTIASGACSHAEGSGTFASGDVSHAEGQGVIAEGAASHAEGNNAVASGVYSHAEGVGTIASGHSSHAEGQGTIANHKNQHVFGQYNIEDNSSTGFNYQGNYVEIVGNGTAVSEQNVTRSNARTLDWSGNETLAGKLTLGAAPTNNMDAATKQYVDNAIAGSGGGGSSFDLSDRMAKGTGAKAVQIGQLDSTQGYDDYDTLITIAGTTASGDYSFAEGEHTEASNKASHAEGGYTVASGEYSHAEGHNTTASGNYSHAEGIGTQASGLYSHAEGYTSQALEESSHAEGSSRATARMAHAEGNSVASGQCSHSEGANSTASGNGSHAEGYNAIASGAYSHAEGSATRAYGDYSHAEGQGIVAKYRAQHVFGEYNIEDGSPASSNQRGAYVEIVGNGTSSKRSNVRTLDWSGNEWIAGNFFMDGSIITMAGTSGAKYQIVIDDTTDPSTPTLKITALVQN